MTCEYGCDQEAKYQLKNGKWCCDRSWQLCPGSRKKKSEKYREITKHDENVNNYYLSPRLCKYCGKIIPFSKRNRNIFCNSSCSAKYNDSNRVISETHKDKISRSLRIYHNTYDGTPRKLPSKRGRYKYDLKDILDGKYPNYPSDDLKSRLIKEGIKEYKCEVCGISDWQNKKLIIQLHHIDGNSHNHNLKNIILLCPNCHTQTPNWGTKKLKKLK